MSKVKYNRERCQHAIEAGYGKVHTRALAQAVGVHPTTIRAWMIDDHVSDEVEARILAALSEGRAVTSEVE